MPLKEIELKLSCLDVPKTDFTGWSDPYITIHESKTGNLNDATQIHKTEYRNSVKEANFDDFKLKVSKNYTYYFKLMDRDVGSKDDFVGVTSGIGGEDLIMGNNLNPVITKIQTTNTGDQEIEIKGHVLSGTRFVDKQVKNQAPTRIMISVKKEIMYLAVNLSDLASTDLVGTDEYYFKVYLQKHGITREKSRFGFSKSDTSIKKPFYKSEIIANKSLIKKFK